MSEFNAEQPALDLPTLPVDADSTGKAGFPDHASSGVDLSLLRWMLSISPIERLAVMEQNARDTLTLLEYGRQHRQTQARRDC